MEQRRKENQRVRLTKRLLKESLLDLLEEKPLEKISVRELCEHSELNRSTFYANYSDIYQLYQEMCDELTEDLEQYVQASAKEEGHQTIAHMLEYIRSRERLCSRLLYGGWLTGRQNPIQARITQLTLGNISCLYENVAPEYRDYVMNYCYMGGNALIIQWIRNKFDLEPETVARMSVTFSALITQHAIAHPFREEEKEG